jgi:hypothetical protein
MKKTHMNAIEILKKGSAIPASEWKTATGRYTSTRAIPEHCDVVATKDILSTFTGGERKGMYVFSMPNETRALLRERSKARPQVRKWIYISDLDGLLNAIKEA